MKFSDGSPLTAQVVKANIAHYLKDAINPALLGSAGLLGTYGIPTDQIVIPGGGWLQ